jgi:hypothetical protein
MLHQTAEKMIESFTIRYDVVLEKLSLLPVKELHLHFSSRSTDTADITS